jgi:hypothetical protein
MKPAALIREAQADGVMIELSPAGTLKVAGRAEVVHRWLPRLCQHKTEIVEALKPSGPPEEPLSPEGEAAIRRWLDEIGETDREIIEDLIERCRRDFGAQDYFLRRARGQ